MEGKYAPWGTDEGKATHFAGEAPWEAARAAFGERDPEYDGAMRACVVRESAVEA